MDAGIRIQRYACRIAEASVAMSKSGVADDGTRVLYGKGARIRASGTIFGAHQHFKPEHLLKILLDDKEGLASNLISAAGGDLKIARTEVELALSNLPKVEGSGVSQIYLAPEMARLFESTEERIR